MPASQARVVTGRASRYLTQLCQHTGQLSTLGRHALARRHGHGGGGAAPMPRHAEWSGTDGVIDFGGGRCTLHATDEELELNAEASDQLQLRRIQEAITGRLEQIGRRDQLTVTWGPSQ
jgi:hypothetical protein